MPKKKYTLDQALERLEEITERIEDIATPLEQSLELYKEGVELSVFCAGKIESAKQEITVLRKTAEGLFENGV
ncbi:MAG: exodeoxyribonuclease VII small subunit [Clostridiales bacterium]|jgi:exodeoxyribonuclease VII small subunit|nr:exodeoxyribonuclease VII small subunit [Clostridiales bacterium]